MTKYNYLEVCAGCGGLSYGLELAGLNASVLIEMEKNCIETLKKNFTHENINIIKSDLRNIDYSQYHGKIDLLAGGIPCQSYSIAGKREGLDNVDKGGLFYDYLKALDAIKPSMFLIENVEGLLNIDDGNTIKFMIEELEKRSYKVHYKLLDASKYNVPQKRKRLFIIGTILNVSFEFPQSFDNVLTMKDALNNVPTSAGIEYSEEKKKVMAQVPPGGCWINLPEEVKIKYMGNSINSGGGKRGIARRLSWDEPCLTLTTSPCQKQTERCHPDETRPLKTREYARIQTFPDSFQFSGSTNNIYKQIGNAVPCMLAYHVGVQIYKALQEIEIKKLIFVIVKEYLEGSVKLENMNNLTNLIKTYFKQHIANIYLDKVDRTKITVDLMKKEMDKVCYNLTEEQWIEFDTNRVRDKQLNNKIGELHEYILSHINNDFEQCVKGDTLVDMKKKDNTVFIELKNKYNTIKGSDVKVVIKKLQDLKKKYPDALCLIGIINGKDNESSKKLISKKGEPEVYMYTGSYLFELVTGNKDYYTNITNIINTHMKDWLKEEKEEKEKEEKEKENIVLKGKSKCKSKRSTKTKSVKVTTIIETVSPTTSENEAKPKKRKTRSKNVDL